MNTYNVTGTIDGVYVALTVKADSFTEARDAALKLEPHMIVTNIVQIGVANA